MATIDVRRTHALPRDEARKRAEELARSMQQRFELDWRWEGDRIPEGLLRLSVGLEEPEALWEDLAGALG